jgi:hypothetical protein
VTGPDLDPASPADDGRPTAPEPPVSEPPVSDAPVSDPGVTGPARVSWRAVAAWLVVAGAAIAIDGLVGGLAMVFVAAVLLAGISTRVIGAVGVALLAAAPVAILVEGVPSQSSVSPAFVSRSLVPHHLTFAGLILVGAFALIDLAPHLRAWAEGEHPAQDDGPPLGTVGGVVAVVVVAVGALAACWAVLGA